MDTQQQQTAVVVQHLDVIAAKARKGLRKVAEGEDKTMDGWLEYGAALLEGREQFPSNEQFGRWVQSNLDQTVHPGDRQAAMWAAGYPEQFRETKKANPRVRTVRGLHAKWKANAKPAPAKVEPTTDDLETITKLKTLAERGATEGERESAQSKLEAFTSAFGDQKDEVIEKAKQHEEDEPEEKVVQKFETLLSMQPNQWLSKKLLQAMLSNKKFFAQIVKELNDNV